LDDTRIPEGPDLASTGVQKGINKKTIIWSVKGKEEESAAASGKKKAD
jgi:hypothetical protein